MEYIERETTLKIIDSYGSTVSEDGQVVYKAIRDIVDFICPSADVVEVVRCKDCKHRKTAECLMYVECDCGSQHTWECDNDFCSYGERRCEE